jgi:hypothetical protein
MTRQAAENRSPRLRATLIGVGLDDQGGLNRIITGKDCLVVGGSEETHAAILETMLRLESELERRGQCLAELPPDELAEVAWRIDSPELHDIAMRLGAELDHRGLSFYDSTADELTELASG